ncbi:rhamnan synthesis F family protein [Marinobacter sp. W-8]|uniref:rhamnan synthesis F family protein n=1 Tax=Marinobacter sp. W-8 TaxID=3369658 RepID=UPI0037CCC12A
MLNSVKKGIKKVVRGKVSDPSGGVWRQARDSGLFNPVWYEDTYHKKFDSHKAAFEDYMRVSRFSPVNPSPFFDTETYHKQNHDVFHNELSPLFHYLTFGQAEGRACQPAKARWTPKSTEPFDPVLSAEAAVMKVAVCLHIFYDDFIEKFADALKLFPAEVDVFVAVSDEKITARAEAVFSAVANVSTVKVVVAPNRGRNFGPLLVEFGSALLSYDLVCHLHSKKSLYSGREQTQWADYLCEYLLRDRAVTTAALNRFARDESVGVYYPITFWAMPTWTNHVLMNAGNLKAWEKDLELDPISGFISYPAGGMFWARPAALKQLLERDWNYEDFPAEPLPNDGSMLHGLERIIGRLAEKNGFRELFYAPTSGHLTFDQTYIGASYYTDFETYVPLIRGQECVGFDVFDTLLRREYYYPDYAKMLLGKELVEQGRVHSVRDFVEQRNHAEWVARERKKFQGDVSIYEAYEVLSELLDVDKSVARQWADNEFEFDLGMVVPRQEIVSLFNQLGSEGYKLWIISDTYYTEDQIALMLKKVGVTAPHRLMVSSAMQVRKDAGSMWEIVVRDLESEGIKRFAHIGDNVVSDAQVPGNYGILSTIHILNPLEKWRLMGFPSVFDSGLPPEEQILKWGKLVSVNGSTAFIGG